MIEIKRDDEIILRVNEYDVKDWQTKFHDVISEITDIESILNDISYEDDISDIDFSNKETVDNLKQKGFFDRLGEIFIVDDFYSLAEKGEDKDKCRRGYEITISENERTNKVIKYPREYIETEYWLD